MRVQGHRTGHAPYIAAACRAIETRGILVADVRTTASSGGRRAATLLLRPDETAFAERVPAEASAAWDEEDGWSLAVGGAPEASCVHKGLGVVPDPEDVAAWIEVVLAHPELTPSREDHPFRDHSVADPGFEAQLARYAPGV
jgi:hypothetical protein